jgi:3-isopropylmalate/(R)-2-methylmalate dehydratase large subunit
MGQTFAEKVLAMKAGLQSVSPGQIVTVKPDLLLSHDNTAAIVAKIKQELNDYGVWDPSRHVVVLDHVIPADSEKEAKSHQEIRNYVHRCGVRHFFDVGEGICHQVMIEQKLAQPGLLILGSDSHTCTYGAVNAFATGIDRTEAAALILTGSSEYPYYIFRKTAPQGNSQGCDTPYYRRFKSGWSELFLGRVPWFG